MYYHRYYVQLKATYLQKYQSLHHEAPLTRTIRGKAINSMQLKIPKPDSKQSKHQDTIKHCMEQLSKSAIEVAARISSQTTTHVAHDEEWQVLRYIITHVPENKKLMCISDFFRIAEIYRKGGYPLITEQTS